MKIITNSISQMTLQKGEYHTLTFSSTMHQMEFRNLMDRFFRNRKGEVDSNYLFIVDENNDNINYKDLYYMNFNCNIINLAEEKTTKTQLQEMLHYYLENNSHFVEQYLNFYEVLEQFVHSLRLEGNGLTIDFYPTNRTIKQIVNSLEIDISNDENNYVPNYKLRHYLIELLLSLNKNKKQPFLFLMYPETDIGHDDFSKVIEQIKSLNITTLTLTTQKDFLNSADIDRMFLVKSNGELYDVRGIKDELESLKLVKSNELEQLAKVVSYYDFHNQYHYLDRDLREFIESNKF